MPKQKARKVVVSFTIALFEGNSKESLKSLRERAKGEVPYVGEAVGGDVKKVAVTEAE